MYDFKNLYEPKTVREALELRKEHPEALVLAGGSDILIQIREGKLAGCDLISIFALDELRGICLEDDGTLLIRPPCQLYRCGDAPPYQEAYASPG